MRIRLSLSNFLGFRAKTAQISKFVGPIYAYQSLKPLIWTISGRFLHYFDEKKGEICVSGLNSVENRVMREYCFESTAESTEYLRMRVSA